MVTFEYIKEYCFSIGIDDIKINSRFTELDIDSLTIIELINQIENDFKITVPWSSFNNKQTIEEFINTVNAL